MRKIFSLGRKQTTVLITLAILSVAVFWYCFEYIPKNERALDEQHFRWLQKADQNVRTKIEGVDTLLNHLLTAYLNNNADSVEKYIKAYTVPNATLSVYKTLFDTSNIKDKPTQNKNEAKADTNGILLGLSWDSSTDKLTFTASKKNPENDSQYNVVMTSDFGKFISPLLTPDLFEHYVVFYNGKYIYEDFHSGLGYNINNEDSLLTTGKNMTGANIIKQKVGGIDYQIFLQPINFFSSGRLIIAGLLSEKRADTEKKQLPTGIIILSIIIALGILLFLPWIKIYFQGKYDKIDLKDATASAVVAKLLISLIVLLCFTYNNPFRPDVEKDSKNFLADTIASSFAHEIDSAFMCLQRFDSVAYNEHMLYDVADLGKDTLRYKTGDSIFKGDYTKKANPFKQPTCPITYYEVNWLDNTGSLKYGWTTSNQNNIHANYSYRDYFKKIMSGNTTSLNIPQTTPIAIDQITSSTNGTFRTVICKTSKLDSLKNKDSAAKLVALSFTMKSLDSVIMPAGYSFAIIDNKGNVKYHSKPERNLNENLLEEFSDREELQDALVGGFREEFITKYYEGTYSVLVKPMQGLPYFIVIMSDQSFPGSVQIETFSFTWGMILVFLLLVMLDLFILIIASSRRSLFKKQYFVTSWIWPRRCSENEYRISVKGNLILIVVLIILPILLPEFYDYLSYLFVLFLSIVLSTAFTNTLFLYKYRHEKNKTYQNYKVRCNISSTVFLVILNVFALVSLTWRRYLHVLLFEAIMIGALYIFFSTYKKPETKNDERPEPENEDKYKDHSFIKYYVRMIFTRLVITSVIPALFFYIASYNYETNILVRYRQYVFLKQLQQKFTGKDSDVLTRYNNAVYPDNTWIKSVDTINSAQATDALTAPQINTANLFNAFGVYLEDIATVNNDNFYKTFSDDGALHFNNFFDSVLYAHKENKLYVSNKIFKFSHVDSTKDVSNANSKYVITAGNLNYTFPGIGLRDGLIFWLLLIALLFCFYLILYEVIKKVCSLDLDSILLLNDADKAVHDLIAKEDQRLLWIIGLPADETTEQVKAKIKDSNAVSSLDFNDITITGNKAKDVSQPLTEGAYIITPLKAAEKKNDRWETMKSDVKNAAGKFVLLQNIEDNLDDDAVTKEKMNCIKELLNSGKTIRIISTMHPQKMLEILNRKKDESVTHMDTAAARFMYLTVANAPVVVLPFTKNIAGSGEKTNIPAVDLFLDKELKYTEFLKQLHTESLLRDEEQTITKFREDKLTLRIQFLSSNFYMSIWRSLSSDEKFILYDLAADGLANITNTVAIGLLMSKGLVVEEEGNLHIFNRSFRNFILTAVESTELAHLQMLHNKHSNWSSLQTPLLIVVLVVFVFLAIAQEGLYSRTIAILSGVAAGIPAILKILSMFGTTNTRDVKSTPQE